MDLSKRKVPSEIEHCSKSGKRKKLEDVANGSRKTELGYSIDMPIVISDDDDDDDDDDNDKNHDATRSHASDEQESQDLEEEDEDTSSDDDDDDDGDDDHDDDDDDVSHAEGSEVPEDKSEKQHVRDGDLVDVEVVCEHLFEPKKDLGYVCGICGTVRKHINGSKVGVKSEKAHADGNVSASEPSSSRSAKVVVPEKGFAGTDIIADPRQMRHMKPHHIEGLDFLARHLAAKNPGGCILAQAPLFEKTFMLISFIQGFLAKHPDAKPLFVLPKSVINIWKAEFDMWQAEDIPLLDTYSAKAVDRTQQLEVLKNWVEEKSILFLGHKQFSKMVFGDINARDSEDCRDILLNVTSLIVLDKGDSSRNEMGRVLDAFARVQTPQKVILTSTIYQNHVKDVFNALNAVRPDFLEANDSTRIIKQQLDQEIGEMSAPPHAKTPRLDSIEHNLRSETNSAFRIGLLRELRVLTGGFIHYHTRERLGDLPELVDFVVLLSLNPTQKNEIRIAETRLDKSSLKKSSVVSAIVIHPALATFSERRAESIATDNEIDKVLESIDTNSGVKSRFFVELLNFCETKNEKLLVLSQYLTPLKFLQRLVAKTKGWADGKETFMIKSNMDPEERENSADQFNSSSEAKICFGLIKACGEEMSLVGASRVLILDVHGNPALGRQAIDLAHRPGQQKKVYAYRVVATYSPELEELKTATRREVNTKIWFKVKEERTHRENFSNGFVVPDNSGDLFLCGASLKEDIKAIYVR